MLTYEILRRSWEFKEHVAAPDRDCRTIIVGCMHLMI